MMIGKGKGKVRSRTGHESRTAHMHRDPDSGSPLPGRADWKEENFADEADSVVHKMALARNCRQHSESLPNYS